MLDSGREEKNGAKWWWRNEGKGEYDVQESEKTEEDRWWRAEILKGGGKNEGLKSKYETINGEKKQKQQKAEVMDEWKEIEERERDWEEGLRRASSWRPRGDVSLLNWFHRFP